MGQAESSLVRRESFIHSKLLACKIFCAPLLVACSQAVKVNTEKLTIQSGKVSLKTDFPQASEKKQYLSVGRTNNVRATVNSHCSGHASSMV